jgi:ribosomal-protein-alanine N-acetyltransferase
LSVENFETTALQSARLSLAPLRAQHAAILFEGLSDPAAYRYIPQTPPASVEALQSRYEKLESRRSPDASEHG